MTKQGCANPVPAAPVMQRVEEFIEQHHHLERVTPDGSVERFGGLDVFSQLIGRHPRQINAWRRQKEIDFNTADLILCKLGHFLDWYHDPVLREVYDRGIRQSPAERLQTMRCDQGHDLHEHGMFRGGALHCRVCRNEYQRASRSPEAKQRRREYLKAYKRRMRKTVEDLDVLEAA